LFPSVLALASSGKDKKVDVSTFLYDTVKETAGLGFALRDAIVT
jgi:hypothetical protein